MPRHVQLLLEPVASTSRPSYQGDAPWQMHAAGMSGAAEAADLKNAHLGSRAVSDGGLGRLWIEVDSACAYNSVDMWQD